MKKILSMLIILAITFVNITPVFANSDEIKISLEINQQEIRIGEELKVELDLPSKLQEENINLEETYLTIDNGKETKTIKNLNEDEQNYYFKTVIDSSYFVGENWKFDSLTLIKKDKSSEKINIQPGKTFEIIPTEESIVEDTEVNEKIENSKNQKNDQQEDLQNEKSYRIVEEEKEIKSEYIKNISVVEDNGKAIITADIVGDVTAVKFPTWSIKNGQDDIIWGTGEISNDKVTYVVDMKDHNYEAGSYTTHIYVIDSLGKQKLIDNKTYKILYQKSKISNVQIEDGNGQYVITADVEGYNLQKVQFPTWTTKKGQDDILWKNGKIENGKVKFTVEMKDHKNETGEYTTHIYLTDGLGKQAVVGINHNMPYQKPKISNVQIKDGNGQYVITADVEGYNLQKVQFPTWTTKKGQDDILWKNGKIENGKVKFTVEMKDHKNETGEYTTHIYLTDGLGKQAVVGINHNMLYQKPKISNVQIEDGNGQYVITADVEGYNLQKVQFPTWTTKKGQDDILWKNGKIENGKVKFTVEMKDHKNETGEYTTHIYLTDGLGKQAVVGINHKMLYKKPTITSIKTTSSAGKYTITADIDGYNIKEVKFPTWTKKNGQDDIVWKNGKVEKNRATFTVDFKDHNYEVGTYITHIYVYDSIGNVYIAPVEKNINNNSPIISDVKVSDISSQGYLITCTVTDDYALDRVMFPTWTLEKGQDDIVWEKGNISGNKVTYRVYTKDHNFESGSYQTHIYAYDKAGKYSVISVPITKITVNYSSGWKIIDGSKYLFDAKGKIVSEGLLMIDVSQHNGNIDWTKVKNAGVDGVILRSSWGWTNDFSQMDEKFRRNVKELNRLGIPYGIYHFSYARNYIDGVEEAKYTLRCMEEAGALPTLPVYYDIEYSSYVGDKSASFYTEIVNDYCKTIKAAGYTPGVYANTNYWTNKLYDNSLKKYAKWEANYGPNDGKASAYYRPSSSTQMWQYTSVGKVSGISGNVDMNIWFE